MVILSNTLLGIGGQILDCHVLILIVSWSSCADKKNVGIPGVFTFLRQLSLAIAVWWHTVLVVAENATGKVEGTNDAVVNRLIVDPRPRNIGFAK